MGEHRLTFRLLADLVRVGAAIGAVAALVGIPSFEMAGRSLLVVFVLMVPRATGGVPAPLDLAFGTTLLVALWTSTTGWYAATPMVWLVPAVATGVTAVVLHRVLVTVCVLGDPGRSRRMSVVRRTVLIGLIVGGVWEAYRWFESIALPVLGTHVGPGVALHLLVDASGALVAGLLLAALGGPDRRTRDRGQPAPGRRVGPRGRPPSGLRAPGTGPKVTSPHGS
jgi:hypothetical protein